jgi:xylan 1,4-beta-xylosidase
MHQPCLVVTSLCLAISISVCRAQLRITIDAEASVSPFPHFWEEAFGSGRAILPLRESYRND